MENIGEVRKLTDLPKNVQKLTDLPKNAALFGVCAEKVVSVGSLAVADVDRVGPLN